MAVLNAKKAGALVAPRTLTAKADPLADFDAMPQSHARIGYNNLLVSSSSTNHEKALTPNTWERWDTGSLAATARFQLPSLQLVDFIGIAAHNLAGEVLTLRYATSVGGSLTTIAALSPSNNKAIMHILNTPISMIELAIEYDFSVTREIGILYAGRALQMYQPIYGGHSPIDMSANIEYQSNMSESGQFLGRNIIRRGGESTFNWRHLDPIWYRQRFQPFVEAAKTKPFFISWRPDLEASYPGLFPPSFGYATDDIQPSNMGGGHKLMSVSLSMRSHDDP